MELCQGAPHFPGTIFRSHRTLKCNYDDLVPRGAAPGYNPWYVFHRMGLKEFLAKCGVHEPPSNTSGCPPADDEVAVEGADGPRRIIFDLENISQYEKAAGAKSEGLTFGPCCDYDHLANSSGGH